MPNGLQYNQWRNAGDITVNRYKTLSGADAFKLPPRPTLVILLVIGSVFFFVRWFVGRFGRAVGQIHSLPSFGFSVGLCGLAMCVAVERWLFHTCHFAG